MFHEKQWNAVLTICAVAALSGCGKDVVPTKSLAKPESSLMAPSPPAPALKSGSTVSDLLQAHAALKAQYGKEAGKLKGLRRYVKALHGDK